MKQSKYIPEALILEEGFYLEQNYSNYEMMSKSAKNWKYNCTYQLKPNAFLGYHRVLQLSSMQLAYASRPGGMMNDSYFGLDCITVAIVETCADKACFHRTKLEVGDIIFFDDSRPYNFMTNDKVSFTVINMRTDILHSLQPKISEALNHKIKDTDGIFNTLMQETWDRCKNSQKENIHTFKDTEDKILSVLKTLLETQTPKMTKLTKGEKITLDIRDQVYEHMDGIVTIKTLAKQNNISVRSLRNSFQSLFGFTPSNFIRKMKLNLVYRDLTYANPKDETVLNIAQRWGFMHMGHFTKHYKDLFNEKPSHTLKTSNYHKETMAEECVERQEEIL